MLEVELRTVLSKVGTLGRVTGYLPYFRHSFGDGTYGPAAELERERPEAPSAIDPYDSMTGIVHDVLGIN